MTKMGEDDVITIVVADAERITNALRLSDMVLRAEFEGDELADWDPQDLQNRSRAALTCCAVNSKRAVSSFPFPRSEEGEVVAMIHDRDEVLVVGLYAKYFPARRRQRRSS